MDPNPPTTPLGGGTVRRRIGDRYVLQGLLGQGGMAEVQLAFDEKLDRQVAVKILHGRFASDDGFIARFRREAQAAASLNHPNIVSVYDTGEDDGRPYIVMEYVSGRALSDVLRREGVLPQRAAEIAADAAAALHYAHERGLVHRDVKPGNIMVRDDGQVKVADFGIARAVNAETVTQTAAVFGTAAYVAPEQARGLPVDRRTDVYALGCVLYEMLTGRAPFAADSAVALAYKHVSEDPIPPSALRSEVTPAMEAVVLRAMAKLPEERYPTAQDLHDDLRRALAGQRVVATPPPPAAAAATTQVITREPEPTLVAPARGRETVVVQRRRDSSRGLGYAILALLVLALFVLAGFLLANVFRAEEEPEPEPLVTVPNVVGADIVAAQDALRQLGLEPVLEDPVNDAAIPPNQVIAAEPPPGQTVEVGAEVRLTFSAGPKLVVVPDLLNRPLQEAEALLRDAGLGIGTHTQAPNNDIAADLVAGSNPPQGAQVPEGTPVALIISSGPPLVPVPIVEGLTIEEAIDVLARACEDPQPCLVAREAGEEFSDDVAEGAILDQDPEGEEQVPPGTEVFFVVSAGRAEPPPPTEEPTTEEPTVEPTTEEPTVEPTTEPADPPTPTVDPTLSPFPTG